MHLNESYERKAAVAAELETWVSGREIGRRTVDDFGTTLVVTEHAGDPDSYSVVRGFMIGSKAVASVDRYHVSLDVAVAYLLDGFSMG